MKRDDPALDPAAGDAGAKPVIRRRAGWFGDGLFGWYHDTAGATRGVVAVICPPIGPEYTRSHRTLRHLADRLAAAGIPTLRFDYRGSGDSAGEDDAPGRVEGWRASIAQAAEHARAASGCRRVCLVGVRLGASLAALQAAEAGADLVVLWNPVVKGRAFVRELQAMALTAGTPSAPSPDGTLESAGFRASAEAIDAIRAVDLNAAPIPKAARLLLLERDDLAGDTSLAARLEREGVAHDRLAAPGWNAMMADHQYTVVPDEALAIVRDWVLAHAGPETRTSKPGDGQAGRVELGGIDEALCRFGDDGRIFGILSRPKSHADVAVVLLNAGSIHHVGPHRLYVRLARELARCGHPTLRLDFEGIGDSVPRAGVRENHPYPAGAMDDLAAAIAGLRRDHGCARFVVMGVCSGAYNAFQAALTLDPIERVVLVNPMIFHWREGLSLDTTPGSHYEDVAAYGRSMKDPRRWKRLLRGEADLGRLARVAAAHVAKLARGRWVELREWVDPASGSRLSSELRSVFARGRKVHVVLSDGEPAQAILSTEAAAATRRALRSGAMTLQRVNGGDHTFSRHAPREELVRLVRQLLG